MMGLPYGEEIMIVGQTMWTQCTRVTDRQTDRRTDGQNYYHKDRATQSVARKNAGPTANRMSPDHTHTITRCLGGVVVRASNL